MGKQPQCLYLGSSFKPKPCHNDVLQLQADVWKVIPTHTFFLYSQRIFTHQPKGLSIDGNIWNRCFSESLFCSFKVIPQCLSLLAWKSWERSGQQHFARNHSGKNNCGLRQTADGSYIFFSVYWVKNIVASVINAVLTFLIREMFTASIDTPPPPSAQALCIKPQIPWLLCPFALVCRVLLVDRAISLRDTTEFIIVTLRLFHKFIISLLFHEGGGVRGLW